MSPFRDVYCIEVQSERETNITIIRNPVIFNLAFNTEYVL